MSKYIFVVRGEGVPRTASYRPAREVLQSRFNARAWPLNDRTPRQRELTAGDQVLFYVAGDGDPDSHHFIARGELGGSRMRSVRKPEPSRFATPDLYDVPLRSMTFLAAPVDMKPLIERLPFIRNKRLWGTALQGGVRKISDDEFAIIVDAR